MFRRNLIISLIGIYVFWLCILPSIISNTAILACKNLSKNSPYEIQIEGPKTKLSILPTLKFTAKKLIIKTKNKSADVTVENLKIRLRLLPLLSGRLHINNINIAKIFLNAELVDDLALDKDFFKKLETTKIRCNSITLGEFKAQLYQKDIKEPISYQGKDFSYQRKNKYIKLKTNSTLNVSGKISKVTSNLFLPKNNDIKKTFFDVEVSNVDIAPLRAYFKHYLPKDLKELRGGVSIHANKDELVTELNNCSILMNDNAKSVIFPEKMFIKSKFNITKNYINLNEVDIDSNNIHISMDGKISEYFGKTMPSILLNIRVNKSRVEDIINILPAFKVEEIDTYKLKKYKFYGETLANLKIKGRLPEPDIFGDVYVNDGILTKPIPNTTKGATIKLNFTGKQAHFDVFVPAGNLEKVWVKGSQEIYSSKYAELTVKSTKSVNLKSAQNVVNPLHEILNFIIGPVPIMDINGIGNIDILVKGNRKNPHVWGDLNFSNVTTNFLEVPDFILKNAEANLKFNDQNAIFTTQKGYVNGKDININGTCNLFGKFDFDVTSQSQATEDLYKAIQSSTMIPEVKNMIPKFDSVKGITDLSLKIFGEIIDINDIRFNQNLFAKGNIVLKNNNFFIQNINVDNTNGKIIFDTVNADADIKASIGDLPLTIKAKIQNAIADVVINIPKLNPNFLISDIETRQKQYLPYISVSGKYKGKINDIEYNKLNMKATILDSIANSKIKYQPAGAVIIANNKISIKNIKGYISNKENLFDINLNVNDAFAKEIDVNGNIKLKTPDLALYNEILESDILPEKIKKYTKDYQFKKGAFNLDARILNNRIYTSTDLAGISFVYLPYEMPVEIINGNLAVRNNTLKLNKINLLADNMPVLVDGEIKDIFEKQSFNLYFNSKPIQEFIDKYINKNQIYPIKIKGDIVYWVKVKGDLKDFDLKSQIDMSKESSFYHFGATIGDLENAISVLIDSKITNGNEHRIKEFSYDKIIDSQSGRKTRLNMLKAWGGFKLLKDDVAFENLRIKTNHPTDARIFNIIFRKPNIKQGQFTSDLKITGKLSNPKVIGDFHIFETNIPFLDTTMKNIELVFKDKIIEFDSKGEVLSNDIDFSGTIKNKLTAPYKIEKAYLYTKDLDLNQIVNKIKLAEVDNVSAFDSIERLDLKSISADSFKLKADNIKLRNIHATDFEADTSLSEKNVFTVNNFKFNIAQGMLGGKYSYNLKNNDMGINLNAINISANDITWALFDLNNQIYGDLTGNVNLTCNGADFNSCMQTLSGNTIFNVKDGKMPKLGSLEYLLKAGNLVKGGLTGLSINSVVDLIAPSKTGNFSDIFGAIRIKDGVARNIEITTKGEDLSLFIGGTYNFATSIADMEVLGLLSRKISTMFGPIGNMSINTLFNIIPGVDLSKDSLVLERINKIPGIELSSKAYRKFIAEIKGNINGDDYVTSFKWIN